MKTDKENTPEQLIRKHNQIIRKYDRLLLICAFLLGMGVGAFVMALVFGYVTDTL